jgi:protein tyrosine phosphatase (PTP) superfamily phosphohydrolase (DUF442 family)
VSYLPHEAEAEASRTILAHIDSKHIDAQSDAFDDALAHMFSSCRSSADVYGIVEETGMIEVRAAYSITGQPMIVDLTDLVILEEVDE